ncbi:hypothetical protein TNCV_5134431 [Trichonephila clavipes]|nr:hypothetical protein TNCV_5134431 [Trichonephila clavipes]
MAAVDFLHLENPPPKLHEVFLATDLVILNHGQVMRTIPERAASSPNYHALQRGCLSSTDKTCIAPLHGEFSVVLALNS